MLSSAEAANIKFRIKNESSITKKSMDWISRLQIMRKRFTFQKPRSKELFFLDFAP